jgi:predicted GNAT family N-acyltransferase
MEILDALAPLRFDEASDPSGLDACFRLRYRAVLEMRMAPDARFPDGLERDDLDDDAIHIVGRDGERIIATMRIVLPSAERPLPTEQAFDIRLHEGVRAVEWGRVVVDPDYRGDGHSVFMGLAARGWQATRSRGRSVVIGATPKRLLALFDALGFEVSLLGPPRTYWGEERWPILCDGGPAIPGVRRAWLAGGLTDPPTGPASALPDPGVPATDDQ